jgi:Fur family transcriptional regulator, stress-responsive regulator
MVSSFGSSRPLWAAFTGRSEQQNQFPHFLRVNFSLRAVLNPTVESVAQIFLDSFQKRSSVVVVGQTADFRQLLQEAALRVTRPRVAVLSAVYAHPHSDTDSIIRAVRQELPEVSHQTVYDSLNALTASGLVRRIQPSGSVARYESRVADNHHHVVCRACGVIADVDCAVGDAPCLVASDDNGFTIDEAEVIYWGLCPDCSTSHTSGSRP